MRILYNSKDKKYKSVFGTLRENEGCTLNIYIPTQCKTTKVELVFQREDGESFSVYTMFRSTVEGDYEIYSCDVSFAKHGLFFYYFVIETENERFSLYKQGYDMTNMEEGELWQLSVIPGDFCVPEMYNGAVMYQIFPDRFNKSGLCDVSEKLKPFWMHDDSEDIPCWLPDEKGIVQNNDFFGGNLKGITEKIEYLKTLNVGVLYLNPIFKAFSNHRYDTADYLKIDEMLGNEEDLKELFAAAHRAGIKVILDGVFSHTGSNSVYFDSEKTFGNGACSSDESPYREWYDFKRYPDDYTAWWGIKTLPCVDENNKGYRDYIIENEDSVVSHWVKLGADGFRLDVADELPDSFILQFRNKLKTLKSDSFLVGEVWEDASNKSSYGVRRKYFTDGELDSVMNYPWRNAIIDFVLCKDSGYSLKNTVMTIAENYPKDVVNCIMNILSTHDTSRIISCLGVEEVPTDRSIRAEFSMSEDMYSSAKEKLFCAVFLQFILPGMPCIYYGDEIGMEGFEDPFCRAFFKWDRIRNNEILEFYKAISKVKYESKALKFGDVNITVERDGIIRIERAVDSISLTAYINMSDGVFVVEDNRNVIIHKNAEIEGNKKLTNKFGFILLG